MYELLKQNLLYKDFKNYGNNFHFYELMMATLIALENKNDKMNSSLFLVKGLISETNLGLKVCKDWYDIMKSLGFISYDSKTFEIKESITEMNSINDLITMIDNQLTIEQFLRIKKLRKIKNKING